MESMAPAACLHKIRKTSHKSTTSHINSSEDQALGKTGHPRLPAVLTKAQRSVSRTSKKSLLEGVLLAVCPAPEAQVPYAIPPLEVISNRNPPSTEA